jgi:hypothetical protein
MVKHRANRAGDGFPCSRRPLGAAQSKGATVFTEIGKTLQIARAQTPLDRAVTVVTHYRTFLHLVAPVKRRKSRQSVLGFRHSEASVPKTFAGGVF